MDKLFDYLSVVALCTVLLLLGTTRPAGAQEVVLDLPHDYPPSGQRLRTLADIADFQFGYASRDQFNEQEHALRYDAIVRSEFNIVTPENANKWQDFHPEPDTYVFSSMDNLVDFAEANTMAVHGHPLLWHQLNPEWIETLPAAEVEGAMNDHIDTVMARYAGRVEAWDVVNEALEDTVNGGGFRENLWYVAMGESYVEKAFRRARAADPDAILIYNDYDVGWLNEKSDELYVLISDLLAQGVPIDAVGFQMHLRTNFTAFDDFSTNMQRFADLGLDIYITELDVQIANQVNSEAELAIQYDLQADVYQETLQRCLTQPKCQALQIWGINDYYSWLPWFDPLPFDNQYNVKPAYFGLQRALSTLVVDLENFSETAGMTSEAGLAFVDTATATAEPAWVKFDRVDLRGGFQTATMRYRNVGAADVPLSVVQDALDGTALAQVVLSTTGTGFQEITVPMTAASTIADLYVVIPDASDKVSIDYLLLESPTNPLEALPDLTDGGSTDGSATDGSATDGSATDGSATDGSATDGSATDGSATDGSATDGSATDGSATDGEESGGGGAVTTSLLLLSCLVARRRRRVGQSRCSALQ